MPSLSVFWREMTIATRRGQLQTSRTWFAAILLVIVLGTFASWYFAAGGRMTRQMMSEVAERSYLFVGIAYATVLLGLATLAATSIAGEMDRKTLGFVLGTRLRSAEIVVGKLAALLIRFVMDLGIGLPIMILLSVLGGVPPQLVLIAYAGISSTAVIVLAIGIFVSAGAANARRAVNVTLFSIMAWLILPVFVGTTPILSSIGLRPPQFVMDLNAWLLVQQSDHFASDVPHRRGATRGAVLQRGLDVRPATGGRSDSCSGCDRPAAAGVPGQCGR